MMVGFNMVGTDEGTNGKGCFDLFMFSFPSHTVSPPLSFMVV